MQLSHWVHLTLGYNMLCQFRKNVEHMRDNSNLRSKNVFSCLFLNYVNCKGTQYHLSVSMYIDLLDSCKQLSEHHYTLYSCSLPTCNNMNRDQLGRHFLPGTKSEYLDICTKFECIGICAGIIFRGE